MLAGVLFAAYVSFVPFQFAGNVTVHQAATALLRRRAWVLGSRSNFVGNIILFLPIGFAAAAAVFGRRTGWVVRGGLALGLLAASAAVSISIESLQAFLPGRVPAVSDCVAQTVGTLVGILVWATVEPDVHAWWSRRRGGTAGRLSLVWLALYAAAYGAAALLPLNVTLDAGTLVRKWRAGGIVLNPLHSASWTWSLLPAVLGSVVLAIPIGLLASVSGVRMGRRRGAAAALFIGAAIVVAIEAAQVFVISRTADTADAAVAFIGVVIGVAIAASVLPRAYHPSAGHENGRPTTWAAFAWVASLVVYALYNWSPFDFHVSGAFVHSRLPEFWRPPFYASYENSALKAVGDTLMKLAISAPMGFFWSLWTRGAFPSFRRAPVVIGAIAMVTFIALVEVGQLLLPSRYPDMTDILLGVAGYAIGHALVHLSPGRTRQPEDAAPGVPDVPDVPVVPKD